MTLMLHPSSLSSSSSSFGTNRPHFLLRLRSPLQLKPSFKFGIKFQQDSSAEEEPTSVSGPYSKKPGVSTGLGFGSSAAAPSKKSLSKGQRERASVIRREPVEKPTFTTPQGAARAEELRKNESAFLLAWLGLGAIILLEGITLAASGFLPESWDNFLVKYLYPAFTPTVFLFVAGTVTYGVSKYLQNENSSSKN